MKTTIYRYINPFMKDFTGEATELTLDFERKDYGQLNPVGMKSAEIDSMMNKIYTKHGVVPISCYIYEEEPVNTWYGWLRKFKVVLTATQDSPILVVLIPAIVGIISSGLIIWGLTLIKQTSRIVFVEGGEVTTKVVKALPWIIGGIAAIVLIIYFGKRLGGEKKFFPAPKEGNLE